MGKYRLGNFIRMTRKSLSITQETLCDGICSVETLSRMESGKQKPSKETYELLMERMGRIKDRAYSILSISDLKFLEKKILFEDYIHDFNYAQAELVLEDIKKYMGSSVLDRQYVDRAHYMNEYRFNRISGHELLERLIETLKFTIPRFGEISLANWPLNYLEASLLLNIATVKAEIEDYVGAINLLEEANSALKQSYMDEEQRVVMETTHLYNLSKWHGVLGENDETMEIIEKGLKLSLENKLGNALPHLLYNIAWLIYHKSEGAPIKENIEDSIKYFTKAYYIASSMQMSFLVDFFEKVINEKYVEYKELFLI